MGKIFASRLRGLRVLTDRGLRVGQIHDMLVDEASGKIQAVLVRPESKEVAKNLPTDESGNIMIPFNAVTAIRDFVVVNERSLAVQQLKAR
ncbi:MAG: PRC-barrel domain-containing protein [Hadesarchaea archaeon]|nr:PRC-barrel domain-containing protein [Hadesarchaea archaeon]